MTSTTRQRANQRNAQHSTGPKTEAGKAASSRNALKHGGYASRDVAITSGDFKEDPDEIGEFIDEIVESLRPRDPVEREEAYNIAWLYLRSRRVRRFEAQSMNRSDERPRPAYEFSDWHIMGYESPEQAERLQNATARANTAKHHLESILTVAARVEGQNSRQLKQAMERFSDLRRRNLDDGSSPADLDTEGIPQDPARTVIRI